MHPRATPNIKGELGEVNGCAIVSKNRNYFTSKVTVKHHDFERLLSVRCLPTTVFFFSYGTEQWWPTADRYNKQHKKQWKGHNELKCRFSNGPTKTEPRKVQ